MHGWNANGFQFLGVLSEKYGFGFHFFLYPLNGFGCTLSPAGFQPGFLLSRVGAWKVTDKKIVTDFFQTLDFSGEWAIQSLGVQFSIQYLPIFPALVFLKIRKFQNCYIGYNGKFRRPVIGVQHRFILKDYIKNF